MQLEQHLPERSRRTHLEECSERCDSQRKKLSSHREGRIRLNEAGHTDPHSGLFERPFRFCEAKMLGIETPGSIFMPRKCPAPTNAGEGSPRTGPEPRIVRRASRLGAAAWTPAHPHLPPSRSPAWNALSSLPSPTPSSAASSAPSSAASSARACGSSASSCANSRTRSSSSTTRFTPTSPSTPPWWGS